MKFKKPKFWDLKKPNFISFILFPLTFFVIFNNFLLSIKSRKKYKKIKTICVGNIYLGGTGKTPTVIKLYNILKKLDLKISAAKKFYKSHLDEIKILKNKTELITERNRKKIIEKSIKENYELLIFDDGLQDHEIDYDLKFVCFDSKNLIGNGSLLPSGPLREKLSSLRKYDAVFLKNAKDENTHEFEELLKEINPNIKIFHTYYEAKNLNKFDLSEKYLIFSGIGNPYSFRKTLSINKFNIIDEIIYPDHFDYDSNTINEIENRAKKKDAKIITTEKDYVKISNFNHNIEFLEIDLKVNNEEDLSNFLKNKLYE